MKPESNKIKYFFILGSNPTLSVAEIIVILGLKDGYFVLNQDFLIVEVDKEIDMEDLMKNLGGTIKIGIIGSSYKANSFRFDANNYFQNLPNDKKFYFGISVYGRLNDKKNDKYINVNINKFGMTAKNNLKQQGISSRFVTSKEKSLSSVIVKKNKLVSEQGVELCILKNGDEIYLGKTLAIQEFEEYGARDYLRPARDAYSGMIPLKLAKIMINLAKGNKTGENAVLLDPFCGSGTVLQESIIMGMKEVLGSDVSKKAVGDTEENLNWLQKDLDLQVDFQVLHKDVRQLGSVIKKSSIDFIVTEPYLGPPLRGGESSDEIEDIIQELSDLYLSAFLEFKKLLKKNGVICMVWPVFVSYDRQQFLPILNKVKNMGFELINLFSEKDKKNLAINLSERETMIYKRSGQKVYREILIFKKN